MTGPSTKPLSEKLAERRQKQMGELDDVTQRLLSEHESDFRQQLSGVRRTTESAISAHNKSLAAALSEAGMMQQQMIQGIEQRLASAAEQAERLSRVGGFRGWTRPAAITVAVMLAVGAVTAGGLLLTDRLIDSRLDRLAVLRQEIRRAEQAPKLLPQGVEIREINGQTYLVGLRVSSDIKERRAGWIGVWGDRPVVQLTE